MGVRIQSGRSGLNGSIQPMKIYEVAEQRRLAIQIDDLSSDPGERARAERQQAETAHRDIGAQSDAHVAARDVHAAWQRRPDTRREGVDGQPASAGARSAAGTRLGIVSRISPSRSSSHFGFTIVMAMTAPVSS